MRMQWKQCSSLEAIQWNSTFRDLSVDTQEIARFGPINKNIEREISRKFFLWILASFVIFFNFFRINHQYMVAGVALTKKHVIFCIFVYDQKMYTARSVCSSSDHTLTPRFLRWHVCISDNYAIHKTDEALAAPQQA